MIILGTNSIKAAGGFNVANSARFDDDPATYLSITPSSAGNLRTWTWSCWLKKSQNGINNYLLSAADDSNNTVNIWINDGDVLECQIKSSGNNYKLSTNRLFRDVSAWYHIVFAVDTTDGTASNRFKLYVNGVQETSFATENYPSQNTDGVLNSQTQTNIGKYDLGSNYLVGYLCEAVLIDGSQLAADSFGEFDEDSGIWKPIDVSGLTFGTNGFYLNFENSSELGTDVSGNSNTLSESGFTAVEQSIDTCTNNFTTLNRLYLSASSLNFTQGNLTNNGNSSNAWRSIYSTIGLTSGKWYFEFRVNKIKSGDLGNMIVGIVSDDQVVHTADNGKFFGTSRGYGYHGKDGKKLNNDTVTDNGGSYGDSFTTVGDIIGCAIDLDNHKIYWRKNGTYQNSGNPESGATGTGSAFDLASGFTYLVAIATYYDDERYSFNFGSPPYSESGGNSDGNTYGNFAGSVPSGYFSINTKNLAEYG